MNNFYKNLSFIFLIAIFYSFSFAQKAELVVKTGHTSEVLSVAFSPDGETFASSSEDGTIKIWNWKTGQELRTIKYDFIYSFNSSPRLVNPFSFSPDGKLLAVQEVTEEYQSNVMLFDITTGKVTKIIKGQSLGLSPDGKQLFVVIVEENRLVLQDLQTGKEFPFQLPETSSEFYKKVSDVGRLSSDRKRVATGGRDNAIRIWDIQTGKILKTFYGHTDSVNSVSFSPDEKFLVSGSSDNTIKVWDISTEKEIKSFSGHKEKVQAVAFSPDGKYIASGSSDQTIKLWNVSTEKEVKTLTRSVCSISNILLEPNGAMLATCFFDNNLKLWDLTSGKPVAILENYTNNINLFAISTNNKILATRGMDEKIIRLWDIESEKEVKILTGNAEDIISIKFSPNNNSLVGVTSETQGIKLWDIKSGKEIFSNQSNGFFIQNSITYSPDGKTLAASVALISPNLQNSIFLWDVESGQELKIFEDSIITAKLVFSSDGTKLAGRDKEDVIIWDVKSGKRLKTLNQGSSCNDIAFSPDSKVIASNNELDIKIWNIETGQPLQSLKVDNPNSIRQVIKIFPDLYVKSKTEPVSFDGKFQFKKEENGKLSIYEVASGNLLATLFLLDQTNWVITTPNGLFDASTEARKMMHYIIGLEPITLEQMKDVYYVPNLLQKILKGESLPPIELFSKKDLFPSVEYEPLKPDQKQFTFKLINRGGGIGQVQLLVNGKEFDEKDLRPKDFNPNATSLTITVDLTDAYIKPGEENKIEIIARNASGSLSTRGSPNVDIRYYAGGSKQTEIPNIYVIAGGVSDYTNDFLKLNFAAKDAEDFAKTIELGAIKMLGDKSKVHIRLLTSRGDKSTVKFNSPDAKILSARKADFEQAFTDFKNATPNDVFIVYLAGHGVSLNLNPNPAQAGGDTYLYLTQDANTIDKSILSVENLRKSIAISSDELKDLMKQNKALKQVLILDTCAAGALANSLVLKRDLPSDQIKAIENLKDNTGFYVLMGSSADAVSYEASQFGQGLLTYSLLQAMKGANLQNGSYAFINDLFAYAQKNVPDLAKNIGGTQRPLVVLPDISAPFPIGQFTAEEQKQIVLSNPKPIILRPNFLNKDQDYDDLDLTEQIKNYLRESNTISSLPSIFVDADEMTDAVKPSGTYLVKGDEIIVNVRLLRNKTPFDTLTIFGNISQKDKLVEKIATGIIEKAKNQP